MAAQAVMENIGRDGAERSGQTTRTLNEFGWQLNQLDEYGTAYVEFAKTATRPVADLGVAFGFSTLALLNQTTAHVIANDLAAEHLDHLYSRATESQRQRLTLFPGDVLDLHFPEESLDGVQALRMLHFLEPEQIREAFQKFGSWIAPGGKLSLTAGTPHIAECVNFLGVYEERKSNGEEWPGFATGDEVCWPEGKSWPHGYFFDTEVMEREAVRAGFKVDKCSYMPRSFAYTNGKENVGLFATKLPRS